MEELLFNRFQQLQVIITLMRYKNVFIWRFIFIVINNLLIRVSAKFKKTFWVKKLRRCRISQRFNMSWRYFRDRIYLLDMELSQLEVDIFIDIVSTKVCNHFSCIAFKIVSCQRLFRAAFILKFVYLDFACLDCILILVTETASYKSTWQ